MEYSAASSLKKTGFKKSVCVLCLSALGIISHAQETVIHYNIVSKKKEKIGELTARRKKVGNEFFYEAQSTMTVKMLLKQHIQYSARVVYKDNILVGAESASYLNDHLHNSCSVKWEQNHYQIIKDSSEYHSFQHRVAYSGIMLYFVEPTKSGKCFSEMNGYLNDLEPLSAHSYSLTDSKSGKQNTYMYKNGTLYYAHIDTPMMDIFLQKAD